MEITTALERSVRRVFKDMDDHVDHYKKRADENAAVLALMKRKPRLVKAAKEWERLRKLTEKQWAILRAAGIDYRHGRLTPDGEHVRLWYPADDEKFRAEGGVVPHVEVRPGARFFLLKLARATPEEGMQMLKEQGIDWTPVAGVSSDKPKRKKAGGLKTEN